MNLIHEAGIAALLLGYLLGSIPFGVVNARIWQLGDLSKIGSGNIGTTNVLRTGNRAAAAMTLLLDAGKGVAAVVIAQSIAGEQFALAAGCAAVIGHMFPPWLRFRGGKGVATFLGVLLGYSVMAGIFACAVWLVVAVLSRYASLSSLLAAIAALGFPWILGWDHGTLFIAIMTALVVFRHWANVGRLVAGTESRISLGGRQSGR